MSESRTPPPTDDVLALLGAVADAAASAGREDLAERMRERAALVTRPDTWVVVAGEYKAGKSSLVNALVGHDVCPIDDDVATAVPTVVRYAPEPSLRVRRETDDGDAADENVPVDGVGAEALAGLVSESADPTGRDRLRAVEVGLPSELLRNGLVLVDTPGVGGIGSDHAAATAAVLGLANAVVFVSDATQEYTAPELEFLGTARATCPHVVPVISKTDIAPEWQRIGERDEAWLGRSGLSVRVVPTSATLSRLARLRHRPELEAESGLSELVGRLQDVAGAARRLAEGDAAAAAHAVVGQLAAPLRAELASLDDPAAPLDELVEAEERTRALAADDAEWVLLLDDGVSDLEDAVEQDAAHRLRAVLEEAERTIAASDPAATWDEFSATLTRRVSAELSAASSRIAAGGQELAAQIAEHFAAHEQAAALAPGGWEAPPGGAGGGNLAFERVGRAQWRGVLVEAGWGGLEALGVMGSILTFTSISLFNPFSLVIGFFVGGRSFRQARQRQVASRREQALEAVNRYLDDAAVAARRERQGTLRRVRRELRTTYQRRAESLHRSARESLAAARRAVETGEPDREARRTDLAARLAQVLALDGRAVALGNSLADSLADSLAGRGANGSP